MQAHNVHLTNEEANLLRELNERLQNARKVKLTLPLATSNFLEGTPQPTSFLSPKKGEHLARENPLKTILIPHSVSKRENEFVNNSNNTHNHNTANNNNNEYDKNQFEFLSQQIRSLQAQVEALAREQREQNQHSSQSTVKEGNTIDSFPSSLKEIPPTLIPKPIPYMEGLVLSRADFLPSGWTDEQSMYSPPSLKLQELDHVKSRKKKRKSDKNSEKTTKIESTKNSHSRPPIYQGHKQSTTNTTTISSSSRSTSPLFRKKPRTISAFSSPKRERILNEDSAKIVKAPDRSTSAQRQRERDIKSDKDETNLKSNSTHMTTKRASTQSKPKTRPEKVSVHVPPSVSADLKNGSKKQTSNRDNSNTNKSVKGKQSSLMGGFTPLLTVKQSKP